MEYFHKVRAEAERLGVNEHIIWAGHRNDVPHIMAALDVYVLASLDEMFPVAVLEAMAAGRAIVATPRRRRAGMRTGQSRPLCLSLPKTPTRWRRRL